MKKNRVVILFIALLLLVALVVPAFATGTTETKKLKIAYIRHTNEPYYKFGFDGAKMMADAMGIELYGYISELKPEKELNAVEDAITQKMDGIVLMSISQTSIESSVNTAYNAKVPIMMLFGYSEALKDKMVGSVQGDGKVSGRTIGKWVADNIAEGEVACIMGQPGRGDAEMYRDAFVSEIKKNPNPTRTHASVILRVLRGYFFRSTRNRASSFSVVARSPKGSNCAQPASTSSAALRSDS